MTVIDTIRHTLVPVHRAGWPFIAAFAAASILLGLLWEPLFWIGMILTAWCAYFFRDPERVTPTDERLVVSGADGIVSLIGPAVPPAELGLGDAEMQRISVFMNVFACHVNRAPVSGRITTRQYRPGKFMNAELDKASSENERSGLVVESPHGTVAVVQIAGLVARRILCWVEPPQQLATGQRIGLIRFGSRVDVYLPGTAQIRAFVGQTAIAGETVLAEFDGVPIARVMKRD